MNRLLTVVFADSGKPHTHVTVFNEAEEELCSLRVQKHRDNGCFEVEAAHHAIGRVLSSLGYPPHTDVQIVIDGEEMELCSLVELLP